MPEAGVVKLRIYEDRLLATGKEPLSLPISTLSQWAKQTLSTLMTMYTTTM